MVSLNDLWESVRKQIEKNSTDIIYRVWLSKLTLVSFDGITAVLATDGFRIKIIRQKFMDIINDAFENAVGFEVAVEFIDPSEGGMPETAKPEAEEDEDNTFDTFVIGPDNRFAHAAAIAVAEKPGVSRNYNPLFIHGSSGLGKTHLLRAINHEVTKNNPDAKVILTSGEKFVNLIIAGIRDHQMQAIHDTYRTADVLLVDDIQFIGGKDSTQEEFFHTFDALINDDKQIVLTSDRPPKEIPVLDERLRTRFEWGLLADIQPPDLETRVAIIQRKAKSLDLELSDEVTKFIAEKIKNNVRQLEGTVKKLKAITILQGGSITVKIAESAIEDILESTAPTPVTVEKIIAEVARTFGSTPENIRSRKRDANTVKMRQAAMYLIRDITGLSTTEIGEEFGKDHSTVLHALTIFEERLKKEPQLRRTVEDIKKNIEDK